LIRELLSENATQKVCGITKKPGDKEERVKGLGSE